MRRKSKQAPPKTFRILHDGPHKRIMSDGRRIPEWPVNQPVLAGKTTVLEPIPCHPALRNAGAGDFGAERPQRAGNRPLDLSSLPLEKADP